MGRARGQTQLTDRRGSIGDEAALEAGVRPRLRDHPRPDMGTDLGLKGINDEIERLRVHVALLGQDSLKRTHAQLHLAELCAVIVLVVCIVLVQVHGGLVVAGLVPAISIGGAQSMTIGMAGTSPAMTALDGSLAQRRPVDYDFGLLPSSRPCGAQG